MKNNKYKRRRRRFLVAFVVFICCVLAFSNRIIEEKSNQVNLEDENAVSNEIQEIAVEDSNVSVTVIGDIMCHNSQYTDAYDSSKSTYDFSYVFDDIDGYLSKADLTIGNLETTFAGKERGYSNYPCFNTPEQLGMELKNQGIDVLSTANNHCMDTRYSGLVSTLNYLDEYGISHMGTNRSVEEQNTILTKEINGIKFAFLSFTYGTNGIAIPEANSYAVNLIDEELIKSQIELAKKENPDLICVNMHWGIEYENVQNSTQEEYCDFLFQNGVDIIFGSHPHVLQPMEKKEVTLENGETKECFVIYSLGNFMSGQTKNYTRSSIILNLDLKKDGKTSKTTIEDVKYIPIYMYKGSSSTKKYKVIDMAKAIYEYDENIDKSIGASTYQTLKSELARLEKMYDGFEIEKNY